VNYSAPEVNHENHGAAISPPHLPRNSETVLTKPDPLPRTASESASQWLTLIETQGCVDFSH